MAGLCKFRLGWCLLLVVNSYYRMSSAQTTIIQPLSLSVFAGENAVFECNTSYTIISTERIWQWFKIPIQRIAYEGESFTNSAYRFIVKNDRKTSIITILNTTMENDQTQYYCQYGSVSKTANLTVMTGTRLDSRYPQCEADMNAINTEKNVTMTCSASGGDPRPDLQWYRNGVKFEEQKDFSNDDSSYYFDEHKHVLNVDDEDAVFRCKAEGLAVDGNQSCQVQLRVPPTVAISSTATVFDIGDSLEFTCLAMTPWTITHYIWTVNNKLLNTSTFSFNITDDKTMLIIHNLESIDTGSELKCEVVTASGLTGNNSVTISLIDESNVFMEIGIAIGALILCICIVLFILIRHRRTQDKTKINKTVLSKEQATFRKHAKEGIVHVVPLDNPTCIYEINPNYDSKEEYFTPPVVRIKLNDNDPDETMDLSDEREHDKGGNLEIYVNAGSSVSLESYCSFNSFDREQGQRNSRMYNLTGSEHSIDQLYARPLDGTNSKTSNTESTDFGDLYAKPKKKKVPTATLR